MSHYRNGRSSGFTLIEALIALLIVMIGLLGVAGMQALAIHNSTQAHIRTLASLDAHSLASVIRSNSAYWTNASLAPANVSIVNKNGAISVSASTLATSANCIAADCTVTQSAAYALNNWAQSLKDLPSGASASITLLAKTAMAPSAYLVQLTWSEKRMDANAETQTSAAAQNYSTSVVVQP